MSKNWHELFMYDESSPTFLRWKVDVLWGKQGNQQNAIAGDVAGSLPSSSRYHSTVAVGYEYFLVHRVIYEMCHGEIPAGMHVDHEDGNGYNNRISNLRCVTRAVNMRNTKKRSDNRTGVTGVCETKSRHGTMNITASWKKLDGKQGSKTFSVAKYGADEAFRLACEYRAAMVAELNKAGAGYTERHGK